jgi:hypothetical protein
MSVRIGLAVALLFLCGSAGAENLCDPGLPADTKSPLHYHMRGDRCEGLYAQQVSSVSVEIRSLVASFGPFDPAKDQELALAWTPPPGATGNVRLRVFSFKPGIYYRMDTAIAAGKGVYRWPTDVLASLGLHSQDLGLIAWIDLPGPGGTPRTVHLPLRVGSAGAAKGGYDVSLFPSARLSEVRLTLSRLDAQGHIAAVLRKDEELGFGYYGSHEPIAFPTNELGPAGFYRLAVTAIPKSGLSVEQDVDLYHAGD